MAGQVILTSDDFEARYCAFTGISFTIERLFRAGVSEFLSSQVTDERRGILSCHGSSPLLRISATLSHNIC